MRNRTRNSFSYGSMWMSLAPFWIADISIRLTSRMTGASPPCFSSDATSICSISSSISTSSSTTRGRFLERLGDHLERRGAVQVRRPAAGSASSRLLLARRRRPARRRVVARDRVGDRRLRRDDRLDVVARHELDVVHGEHVGRVGHRDRQRRAGAAERDDLVLLRGLGRDQLDDRGIDLELRQIDRGHAVLLGEQSGDLLVLDEAELDEIEAELAAVGLLIVQRLLQLGRSDALLLQQQLADADRHRAYRSDEDCSGRQTSMSAASVAGQQNLCWGRQT